MPPRTAMTHEETRAIVLDGYARASQAYRADAFPLEGSGYAYWLGRLTRRLEAGARVLDAGCGSGVPVARELAKRFELTGVDLSPVQIERARGLVPEARFVCADLADVTFGPDSFDAIAAFYSLFHLPLGEQPGVLARMAAWLAPGGWLLATVGAEPWSGVEENWRGVPGARMAYAQADVATYRRWFREARLAIVEDGREPRHGQPGYAMLLARRVDERG